MISAKQTNNTSRGCSIKAEADTTIVIHALYAEEKSNLPWE